MLLVSLMWHSCVKVLLGMHKLRPFQLLHLLITCLMLTFAQNNSWGFAIGKVYCSWVESISNNSRAALNQFIKQVSVW